MAKRDYETEYDGTVERTTTERTVRDRPVTRRPDSREQGGDYVRGDEAARETASTRDGDEFHETLAEPMPNRTYRSDMEAAQPSALEQLVRYVAAILDVLLAIRFVVSLFTTNTSNGFVAFIYGLTNWLVAPFQALFGQTPTGSTTGFFDWAALAAIVVVSVLAALILRLLRGARPAEY